MENKPASLFVLRLGKALAGFSIFRLVDRKLETPKRARYRALIALYPTKYKHYNFSAEQVYGDQNMHDEVRRTCMDYMVSDVL